MTRFTKGFSNAAQLASRSLDEQLDCMRRSQTFGLDSELREELGEVWNVCRTGSWDGHKVLPVTQDTLKQVYDLLEELPYGFLSPSLSVEHNGALSLTWDTGRNWEITLSISNGIIYYGAILGFNHHQGRYVLVDGWPRPLFSLIQRIVD